MRQIRDPHRMFDAPWWVVALVWIALGILILGGQW